jgi:phosphatidylinositol glycan class B
MFFLLLLFRIINSLVVSTYFDPDEFWQSLEVAHNLVYGRGYLTWEWTHGIRSYAHPLLFAAIYKLLDFFNLSNSGLVIIAPKVLQAFFAATTDYYIFKLTEKMFGPRPARWALFCSLVSWFNFYCLVRTYSNSVEACFTAIALFHWPTSSTNGNLIKSLVFAAISCIFRPTSALVWIFLGLHYAFSFPNLTGALIRASVLVGSIAIAFLISLDSYFYREWIFTPWNFVRVNLLENISLFYGSHPFHFYFSQGVPVILLTFLPFTIYGVYQSSPSQRTVFWMCMFFTVALGFQAHKEFRFLIPILGPLLVYAAKGLNEFQIRESMISSQKRYLRLILISTLTLNAALGGYLSIVHKRGVIDVVYWLRKEAATNHINTLFLMPCHSTPLFSYVHFEANLTFITCNPPLGYVRLM